MVLGVRVPHRVPSLSLFSFCPVGAMVAHTTFNRGVGGSSPPQGTVSFIYPCLLVEGCRVLNSDGQGSIPCMDALFHHHHLCQCSLSVRIPDFHSGERGSIPRIGSLYHQYHTRSAADQSIRLLIAYGFESRIGPLFLSSSLLSPSRLAQWVEWRPIKPRVAGSSPASGTSLSLFVTFSG